MTNPYWYIVLASCVALSPILVGLLTSYIKISIVLGMLRSGLGTQQVPSGLIIMSLSFALTAHVMTPTIKETLRIAGELPTLDLHKPPALNDLQRYSPLFEPWRNFMANHAGRREVSALLILSQPTAASAVPVGGHQVDIKTTDSDSLQIVLPAFVLSEIRKGFLMGFVLLLPFLAIDLIVANILAGMGMYMLSPVMISLPLKLILFVVSDGWLLLSKGLITSYGIIS